ncbi:MULTISPECIES: MFS transporter, partial [Heyndrickxia]|uniref:MFS transporter n=1 Tax=Heyndrickxia TaxID=2837504 RepID=UPI002E222FBA
IQVRNLRNLLTGLCLLVIPIFAFLNALNFYVFYIVVFLSATFSMMFELAYLSFVPIIVSREDLYRANRNLEVSRSLSQIFGQSIAGFLINILSAPISIMIDSISYFISLFFMWKIKMNEKRETVTENINIFKRILKGLKVLINSRILLSISISTAILNFCRTAFETIYILYIVRNVGMHASQIGLIYGLGSIGGIIGAYFSEFISKKMGIGISIIGATVLIGVGGICF